MSKIKCQGQWCPKSLEAINTPGFIIRAGVVPYIASTISREAKFLLGIKNGEYTDFGGGCKIKKKEKPFDCARREFEEETMGALKVNAKNITHIVVTGKSRPHQIILLVKVDSFPDEIFEMFEKERDKVAKPELERLEIVTASELTRALKISDSLKSSRHDIARLTRK